LNAAVLLLKKHECLQQNAVLDSRVRGCTLRFWETMYDVLIPQNMTSSPHGWTSWKTYATYYLYLLTGEAPYLINTMDTLCACLQCCDLKTGRMNWAYITDPAVQADVFVRQTAGDGSRGVLERRIVGGQYLPMISDWWRTENAGGIINGYAYPLKNLTDGLFAGASCDNDVHEHFKALDEIGFCAYVHETAPGVFLTYNCEFDGSIITPRGVLTDKALVYLSEGREVRFGNAVYKAGKGFSHIPLSG
jgi:hypothetical protein